MEFQTLTLTPHDFQRAYFDDVVTWLNDENGGTRRMYASPTGTGKSIMALMVREVVPSAILITPRLEIIVGMLAKIGVDATGWSDNQLAAAALERQITTPIRLRNMLAAGRLPFARPDLVILDEAHHDLAETYRQLSAYLGAKCRWLGLTATAFRGTPKGTAELMEKWDGYTQVISIVDAATRGFLAIPRPDVWPLIDDDEITVTNGEFVVTAVDAAVLDASVEIVARCRGFVADSRWNRPTLFAVPTTASVAILKQALNDAGLPAAGVTQDTPRAERNSIFAAAMRGEVAVVQIDVVSEGVDLPFRRLIDVRPTMSPVKWMQQVGRITRPAPEGEPAPEYYCCNRNLERHGYLFSGAIPPRYIAEAQGAFAKPTKRAGIRAFGMESIGRFTAAELPFLDGCTGSLYNLVALDDYTKTEYAALIHPAHTEVLYAKRASFRDTKNDQFAWGRWAQVESLPDIRGYSSAPASTLTPKQSAWWARSAADFGLDPSTNVVNKRNFAALPLLTDLKLTVRK